MESGRGFSDFEADRRRQVVMLGNAAATTLFPNADPLGKSVRVGRHEFTVIGVFGKRPGILGGNPDEFVVIPITTYDKLFPAPRFRGYLLRFMQIAATPREGYTQEQATYGVDAVGL